MGAKNFHIASDFNLEEPLQEEEDDVGKGEMGDLYGPSVLGREGRYGCVRACLAVSTWASCGGPGGQEFT